MEVLPPKVKIKKYILAVGLFIHLHCFPASCKLLEIPAVEMSAFVKYNGARILFRNIQSAKTIYTVGKT